MEVIKTGDLHMRSELELESHSVNLIIVIITGIALTDGLTDYL